MCVSCAFSAAPATPPTHGESVRVTQRTPRDNNNVYVILCKWHAYQFLAPKLRADEGVKIIPTDSSVDDSEVHMQMTTFD